MADPAVAQNVEQVQRRKSMLAVLNFLRKNGFKDAESAFKKEAKLEEDARAGDADDSDMSHTLAAYKSASDPLLYEEYYTNLKEFVENSLDANKFELTGLLYPVFVHMYLELVYNNHEQIAKDFYAKFHTQQEYYYDKDLKQLATVTKPEHMKGNQLLDNFKSNKFSIRMSRESMNSIKRYLFSSERRSKIQRILHEQLLIDVFDGTPRSKEVIDAKAGCALGEAKSEANKQKIFYGIPREPDIAIPVDDDEDDMDKEADKPKKKKAKKDNAAIKKAKNDPNAPAAARIPIPELKDQVKMERIRIAKEAKKCVRVGPDQKPSICFYTFLNASGRVTASSICDDSSLLALGLADSSVQVWTLTKDPLRSMKLAEDLETIDKESDDVLERMMNDRSASACKQLCGHGGPVYGVSFSPDRTLLVSCSEDGTGHLHPVWDVQFSPIGHYFASCSLDRTARLWSTDHQQPLRVLVGHLGDVDCLQFHPNANYIATGSADKTLRLYDVASGNPVRIFSGHKDVVFNIAFSPCGKYIASAGADKLLLIWDVSTGDLCAQLHGHTASIYSCVWSRDSAVVATGSADHTVRIWDLNLVLENQGGDDVIGLTDKDKDAYLIDTYRTKNTPVLCVHFTRRNLLLASGPFYTVNSS